MTITERVLAWAHAEFKAGRAEATGHNDGPPSARYMGGRKEPWCAHFVAACFRECGAPIPGDTVPTPTRANPLASVSYMEGIFKDHGWYQRNPLPGDVAFFKTRGQSDAGPGRHVGIVVDVTDTELITVEGNWGNAVRCVKRPINSLLISGYGRRPELE